MSAAGFTFVETRDLPEAPGRGTVRLAAVQMEPRIGEAPANAGRAIEAVAAARGRRADLIAFPECALTGYCFDDREEALESAVEEGSAPLTRLAEAASDLGATIAVGYLERAAGRLHNTVALIGPHGPVARYRKTHLPHLGVDRFVDAGDEPFAVFEAAGLRVGMLICYDASFPETARLLALAGADLVLLPTNWPQEADVKAGWLPNARAYENVVYFASINRTGIERGFVFHGRSRICAPTGDTLTEGPVDAEAILLADLDPARARAKRIERREGTYWVDRIGGRRHDLYRLLPADPGQDPR